jgi:hypothetical protein
MRLDLSFEVRSERDGTGAAGGVVAAVAVVAAIPATASMVAPGHQGHSAAAVIRAKTAGTRVRA